MKLREIAILGLFFGSLAALVVMAGAGWLGQLPQ